MSLSSRCRRYGVTAATTARGSCGVTADDDGPSTLPADGLLACWGRNRESQLDTPTDTESILISAGYASVCGLHDQG